MSLTVPPARPGYRQKWVADWQAEDGLLGLEWSIRTDPQEYHWDGIVLVESRVIRCPEESYNCQDIQSDPDDREAAIACAESYTIDSEEEADAWYEDERYAEHEAHLRVHEMAAQTLQAWNRGPARALIRMERQIATARRWQRALFVLFLVSAAVAVVADLWPR